MLWLRSLLLIGLLLTSLGGCSKKDAVPAMNTGSYVLDGRTVSCQATQQTSTNSGTDYLYLILTTTPQPSSGPEVLQLNFAKPTGQPNSAYQMLALSGMVLGDGRSGLGSTFHGLGFQNTTYTRAFTNSGGISGTFAGEALASGLSNTTHTLTNGIFTDIQL